jgi:hypothetical protein
MGGASVIESILAATAPLPPPKIASTPDDRILAALIREGGIDRPSTAKRDLTTMQNAFNQWSDESGGYLTTIGRFHAMSVKAVGGALSGRKLERQHK